VPEAARAVSFSMQAGNVWENRRMEPKPGHRFCTPLCGSGTPVLCGFDTSEERFLMKKNLLIAVLLGALCATGRPTSVEATQDRTHQVMVDKLRHAKLLLEAIALSNFAKIRHEAEELIQLSKTAEWMIHKTPRYEMHSNEFRRAAEVMIQKARDKNIDGVSLAYVEMVLSCVKCHQHTRELRDARLPMPADPIGILNQSGERVAAP
jgi:cytochrome c556